MVCVGTSTTTKLTISLHRYTTLLPIPVHSVILGRSEAHALPLHSTFILVLCTPPEQPGLESNVASLITICSNLVTMLWILNPTTRLVIMIHVDAIQVVTVNVCAHLLLRMLKLVMIMVFM